MTIPKLCCIPCPSVCRSSGLSHSTLQKYYCQRPFAGSKKQPISYSLKSIDSGFSMRQLVCIGFQHSFQRFIAILKVYISCQPHKIEQTGNKQHFIIRYLLSHLCSFAAPRFGNFKASNRCLNLSAAKHI